MFLMLLLWHFFLFACFVLFQFGFVLFYYYSLDVCIFSKERQKVCGAGRERRQGGPGRGMVKRNPDHNILYQKYLFFKIKF